MGDRWRVHAGRLRGGYPINPFVATVYIPAAVWMASDVYFNYMYNLRLSAGQITVFATFWRCRSPPLLSPSL
jgi:phosphodiesterase/alkaline phosphatase D-like protein